MEENKNMEMEELEFDELSEVTGGAKKAKKAVDPMKKFEELKAVWKSMKFEKHGGTQHQLEAYMDQWQEQNYKPSAKKFLTSKKTW